MSNSKANSKVSILMIFYFHYSFDERRHQLISFNASRIDYHYIIPEELCLKFEENKKLHPLSEVF